MADLFGPSASARANRSTLANSVAQEIEQRILEGELSAGQKLPNELELGEALQVSRSVVRDAIRTLSARGLVTVRQGVGMVVASPSDAALSDAVIALLMRSELSMGDVIAARAVIESQCAVLAAQRGSTEDFDRLQASLDAFEAATATGDSEVARERHFAFHRGIVRAVHLPALELLLRPMQRVILITSLPARGGDASDWEFERHPPILDAMRRHDEQAAASAVAAHFSTLDGPEYASLRETPFRQAAKLEEWLGLRSNGRPGIHLDT